MGCCTQLQRVCFSPAAVLFTVCLCVVVIDHLIRAERGDGASLEVLRGICIKTSISCIRAYMRSHMMLSSVACLRQPHTGTGWGMTHPRQTDASLFVCSSVLCDDRKAFVGLCC